MAALTVFVLLCYTSLTRVVYGDDDHGSNAVNYDSESFAAGLQTRQNFVMFYAPWCGHCKNLAPVWDELAKSYNKEDSPVIIAKVDCTIHTGLCAQHDVVGFPTLKLFEVEGTSHRRYSGKRDIESLKAFIHDNAGDTAAEEQGPDRQNMPEVPKAKSGLVVLTDDNFEVMVGKGLFFIKFYAPWCGHCQRLAPVWDDLVDTFSHTDKVTIAKIDCTESTSICKQYDISGYPTLLWFKNGQKVEQYQGARTHEALKKFVSDRLQAGVTDEHGQEEEKVPDMGEYSQTVGTVKELTDETFRPRISAGLHFVKFYAPWCGHCKRLAPTWDDLAKEFHNHPVSIAKVDCTQYKTTCDDNQIRGYPTLKLFRDGEFIKDYKGARTLEDLHQFVKQHLGEPHDEL